ncbi:MAG: SGNH/GDSL hydrolase family protein [Wujia sp.]
MKKIIKIITSVLVIILLLAFLQALLMPKYMSDIVEGAMIAEYYDSEKNHDVIFLGDCEVYENFSPCRLWEKYGISSYIRGSAQQLIWQSYYLLEDTLKYEKPKVVVFNIMSLMHSGPESEAYNRMTLDGMRWSESKINSIKASMTEDENIWEYIFPILRYHTRWNSLTSDDFKYLLKKDKVTYEGYYLRVDIRAATEPPTPKPLGNYEFGDYPMEYLDKMRELCDEEGIELVFVKAPSLYPYWYEEWDEQVVEYAEKYGIAYYNFLDLIDEVGIDYSTDTYDGGLHMNLYGAEKLSDYFGKILVEEHDVPDRRDEEEYSVIWEPKVQEYYEDIASLKAEFNIE